MKPATRWWWFAGPIRETDVVDQLAWLEKNGFGGVEIAWVYPQQMVTGRPFTGDGPAWLDRGWSEIVAAAKRHADSVGLTCDFTFGTLWPFGGTFVEPADAAMTFAGPSNQRLVQSWEYPREGLIIDHLSRRALRNYATVMGDALADALQGEFPPFSVTRSRLMSQISGRPGWESAFESSSVTRSRTSSRRIAGLSPTRQTFVSRSFAPAGPARLHVSVVLCELVDFTNLS